MTAFIILVDSEIDEQSTVHEALKGEQSDRWKEAQIKNDTSELVQLYLHLKERTLLGLAGS